MKTGYIDDGYTIEERLEETATYPEVHFEFRPPIGRELQKITYAIQRLRSEGEKSIDKYEEELCQTLVDHVQSWDLCDRNGEVVPIDLDHVLRLDPYLVGDMFARIVNRNRRGQEDDSKN